MHDADATPADPAVLRMERRLRLLEELTEIGMDLARALRHEVSSEAAAPEAQSGPAPTHDAFGDKLPPPPPYPPPTPTPAPATRDPGAAFARLSRAIRLTLALEARTDEALRALRAGVVAQAAEHTASAARRAADDAKAHREAHQKKVRRLVVEVAEREVEDMGDLLDLEDALDDRLSSDWAYAKLETLPLRETVERLCADLQLNPDWSRWTGDDWGPRELFFRPKASWYCRPCRKSMDADLEPGDPEPDVHALE
jgi:hypothetical protein